MKLVPLTSYCFLTLISAAYQAESWSIDFLLDCPGPGCPASIIQGASPPVVGGGPATSPDPSNDYPSSSAISPLPNIPSPPPVPAEMCYTSLGNCQMMEPIMPGSSCYCQSGSGPLFGVAQ